MIARKHLYSQNHEYPMAMGLRIILLPISWVIYIVLRFRHLLFDLKILSSQSFDGPVICVGNLSLGGTGKTPQIEYLIRLLRNNYSVAVLSRGYGRKTKGFLLAEPNMTYREIGDEPRQYLTKFNDVVVAVDEKRANGINTLLNLNPRPQIILLDDAFQHRRVNAGLNILLTDYHNLYPKDYLFPTGRLRDLNLAAKRAHAIVVTKTPKIFSPFTKKRLTEIIKPRLGQKLFFSYIKYGSLLPVATNQKIPIPRSVSTILMFCGIANPYPLEEHLRDKCNELIVKLFPDHHSFSEGDVESIIREYDSILGRNKIMVTTEKDVKRLIDSPYFSAFENLPLFYIPIEVRFHDESSKGFDQFIMDYVRKNTGNS